MKKALITIIAIMLILTSFVGCQANDTQVETPNKVEETNEPVKPEADKEPEVIDENGYSLPIVEPGTLELTFASVDNWYAPASYNTLLPVWAEMEKRTGINIKFEVMPPNQYNTSLNTRIAAGAELPDILRLPESMGDAIPKGYLLPITEQIEKYGTNIKIMFEKYPIVKKSLTAPDGNIYCAGNFTIENNRLSPQGIAIRGDWLEKLNIKEPTTIDEWYKALKAIKDNDPNGNGKADEIPLVASNYGLYDFFGSGFGMPFPVQQFWPDENGKIVYGYTQPEYKELLVFLNKLYTEGLIYAELDANSDEAKINSMISKNIVGTTIHFADGVQTFNALLKENVGEEAKFVIPAPVKGGDVKPQAVLRTPLNAYVGVSKDCKDIDAAVKWLDYVWASDEGTILTMFGIEGKSFEYNADGKPVFTDWILNNPDGLSWISSLRSLGAFGPFLVHRRPDYDIQIVQKSQERVDIINKFEPYYVEPYPTIITTHEESEEAKMITADLETYKEEMIMKFIIGEESLDKFDEYVATLNGMGLGRLIEMEQIKYDRVK